MISDYYDQTVILLDYDESTDPFSTSTGGYTTDVSISAAVNLMSGSERAQWGQLDVNAEYKLYCEPTTEVYYGRRARWDGDTFVMVTEPKNTLQRDHHYRVLLRKA
jgi:hypothetical protein